MNGLTNGAAPGARRFPTGFMWGTGTSSYQIEGGVAEDGRGPSIWDVFTHTSGNVFRGDTGDVACDSYHRIADDVQLLKQLGVGAYRFSISWPRVQPDGCGPANQQGLDYYRRLVEQLLDADITPVVTVYHWDLPQALEDRGGWSSRDTALRMGELALMLGAELGDQVPMWITVNEPLQTAHQGYRVGTHAPGRVDLEAAAAATHHLLVGHGLALAALRDTTPAGTLIGPTLDPHPYIGVDDDGHAVADALDGQYNRVFIGPILRRQYPELERTEMLPPAHVIHDGDMELIGAPIDFLGVNYYRPHFIRRGDWSELRSGEHPIADFPGFVEYQAPDLDVTVMDWPIVPEALHGLLVRLHEESDGLPLYITENGCAADDYVSPEGSVDDYERIAYIHSHLGAALDAIADGVNLRGYFHWSLMDNFEWAHGYRRRFGLHYVDFGTGQRLAKRSAAFYGELARSGELPGSPVMDSGVPAAA